MTSRSHPTRDSVPNFLILECAQCGARLHGARYRYCSKKCETTFNNRARYQPAPPRTNCKFCGDKMGDSKPSPRSHFCSNLCREAARQRSWRNFQRRKHNSTLPQDGPPITDTERSKRTYARLGKVSPTAKLWLPPGWKDRTG